MRSAATTSGATGTATCPWRAHLPSCWWGWPASTSRGTLWRALQGTHDEPAPPSFRLLWLTFSAALLAVFSLQEWIESWVTPGHPSGIAHVAAHVGWIGVALAIVLGAVVAALLHGAHSATHLLAKRHASLRRLRPVSSRGLPLPGPDLPRLDVLAVHRAGRAPPVLCR